MHRTISCHFWLTYINIYVELLDISQDILVYLISRGFLAPNTLLFFLLTVHRIVIVLCRYLRIIRATYFFFQFRAYIFFIFYYSFVNKCGCDSSCLSFRKLN